MYSLVILYYIILDIILYYSILYDIISYLGFLDRGWEVEFKDGNLKPGYFELYGFTLCPSLLPFGMPMLRLPRHLEQPEAVTVVVRAYQKLAQSYCSGGFAKFLDLVAEFPGPRMLTSSSW